MAAKKTKKPKRITVNTIVAELKKYGIEPSSVCQMTGYITGTIFLDGHTFIDVGRDFVSVQVREHFIGDGGLPALIKKLLSPLKDA